MSIQQSALMISAVEDVDCGIGSDCELILSCNNKRFAILLSPRPLPGFNGPDSIEGMYLKKLDTAIMSKKDLEMDDVIQEISSFVTILCQPTFRELAPVPGDQSSKLSLDAFLNPETFKLQVVTHDGKSKIIRREDIASSTFGLRGIKDLPRFQPSQIEVLEKLLGTRIL